VRIQLPSSKSTEQVLQDAFALLQCEKWGGPSVNGWSHLQDYLRCPYRYMLKHVARVRATTVADSSTAQDVGVFSHAISAAHYARQLPDERYPGWRANCPTPTQLLEALEQSGAEAWALAEATRLWDGYVDHWGDDGFMPMAVEMPVGDPDLHTSRYDLVVYVEDNIHDGFWIGEHKFLSPASDLENYNLDGEILGECLSWRLSNLDDVFGPLEGVCVNVVLKSKAPSYRRLWLPVDWNRVRDYELNRRQWNKERAARVESGVFPRSLYGCTARFDRCLFWDHCSTLSPAFLVRKDDQ
jgi:hypothetical protein